MKITRAAILRALWLRRDTTFILRAAQVDLRRHFMASPSKTFVANAHRQFGKSTAAFCIGDEYAWKNPNSIIKIGAPTSKQVKDIVKVVQRTVLKTCPPDLRPVFHKQDSEFHYPNGSIIKLIGVDIGQERLRGTPSDLVILDEVGFMRDLEGLVKDEILPTFNQRPHGRLLMISTPPKVLSHDYSQKFIPKAKLDNSYWELPITRNPDFTAQDIRKFASEYDIVDVTGTILKKGEDTDNFKREYLCEVVPDSNRLIIPEWQLFKTRTPEGFEAHQLITSEVHRPKHYEPLVYADWGFNDHTGVLFGWIDFEQAKLVVAREIWVNNERAATTAARVVQVARETFPGKDLQDIVFWVDADLSLTQEIKGQTGLDWRAVHGWIKANRDANIHRVRLKVAQSQIKVSTQCSNLIEQLDKGIWKTNRQDWERNPLLGHCDLLAALVYMAKNAPWDTNPEPHDYHIDPNVFISPKRKYDDNQHELARAFGGKI